MKKHMKETIAILFAAAALASCATADAGKTADSSAIEAQAPYAKPGFYTNLDSDGRLWVFPEDHEDYKTYLEKGKPVRQVRRIAAGPQGQTLISSEAEHLEAYIVSRPGFYTRVIDGRLWVFPEGSDDHKAYLENGLPVRQVRRIAAGPLGMTVISTEVEHIEAYLAQ